MWGFCKCVVGTASDSTTMKPLLSRTLIEQGSGIGWECASQAKPLVFPVKLPRWKVMLTQNETFSKFNESIRSRHQNVDRAVCERSESQKTRAAALFRFLCVFVSLHICVASTTW